MKLYRDKTETFECDVEIEGASVNKSKARMILHFSNGENVMYEGKMDANGHCLIEFPKMVAKPADGGKAVLEVIAEGAYFTP